MTTEKNQEIKPLTPQELREGIDKARQWLSAPMKNDYRKEALDAIGHVKLLLATIEARETAITKLGKSLADTCDLAAKLSDERDQLRELAEKRELALCERTAERDEAIARIEGAKVGLKTEIAAKERAEGERDAYKRAKAENDERFCNERDDARRERDEALALADARGRVLETLKTNHMQNCYVARVGNEAILGECHPNCQDRKRREALSLTAPEALRQQQEREAAAKELAENLKEFHEEGLVVLDEETRALVGLFGVAVEDGPFDPLKPAPEEGGQA